MADEKDDDLNVDTMGLSDEEKEAMGYTDKEEKEVINEILEDDDDDDDNFDEDEKAEKADLKADKDTPSAKESDEPADEPEDKPSKEFIATPHIDRIEQYDEKMAEFKTQQDELVAKLENGDIDLKEYTQQSRVLTEQETDLKMAKMIADQKEKDIIKSVNDKWEWQQEQFFTQARNKVYGENNMLLAAFNSKTMELAALPENADKSGTWFLQEADKEVRKLFNIGKENADNVHDINKNKDRKPDLKGIPKTLGDLPKADNSEASDNEFAYLDNLEGMDYENALAQISRDPAKEARYLRQA